MFDDIIKVDKPFSDEYHERAYQLYIRCIVNPRSREYVAINYNSIRDNYFIVDGKGALTISTILLGQIEFDKYIDTGRIIVNYNGYKPTFTKIDKETT